MLYPQELSAWTGTVSSQLPHLTRRQAAVLAAYSFAVMLTQSSGISHVSYFLACLLRQRENTVRQRLREWLYDAQDKRGGAAASCGRGAEFCRTSALGGAPVAKR